MIFPPVATALLLQLRPVLGAGLGLGVGVGLGLGDGCGEGDGSGTGEGGEVPAGGGGGAWPGLLGGSDAGDGGGDALLCAVAVGDGAVGLGDWAVSAAACGFERGWFTKAKPHTATTAATRAQTAITRGEVAERTDRRLRAAPIVTGTSRLGGCSDIRSPEAVALTTCRAGSHGTHVFDITQGGLDDQWAVVFTCRTSRSDPGQFVLLERHDCFRTCGANRAHRALYQNLHRLTPESTGSDQFPVTP